MANCAILQLKLFNTAATTGDILRNYWFQTQIYQLLLLLLHNSCIDQCFSKRICNHNKQKYLVCPMFIRIQNTSIAICRWNTMSPLPCFETKKNLNKHGNDWVVPTRQYNNFIPTTPTSLLWNEKKFEQTREWLGCTHQAVQQFYSNYSKNKILNSKLFPLICYPSEILKRNISTHLWTKYTIFFLCK